MHKNFNNNANRIKIVIHKLLMRERVRNCSAFSSPTLLGHKVSGFILVVVRVLQWFVSVWTSLLGRKLRSC